MVYAAARNDHITATASYDLSLLANVLVWMRTGDVASTLDALEYHVSTAVIDADLEATSVTSAAALALAPPTALPRRTALVYRLVSV
jgi:hypothetical protein